LKNPRGEILLDEINSGVDRPLVVHATAGLGLVTFVAIDIDHPALENWKGRPRFIASLLQASSNDHDQSERDTHVGIKQLGYLP
jgi:hypothetical protein